MSAVDHRVGEGADSPLQVPPKGWLAILQRTWMEIGENNVSIIAAGIAFYIFAAIVPTLAAVVLSYGLFADGETVRHNVEAVFASLPRDAASIISDQLLTVVESAKDKQGIGLVIAIALAWYGATKGSAAIITGLNVAYDSEETRGFIRLNLMQLAVVAGGVLLIFVAMGTTMLLAFLNGLIPDAPAVVLTMVRLGGYLLLALLVVTAAAVLFRYGPDRREPEWVWLSPGSVGATLLWLASTAGFGFYVSRFGNYGATYGSLSAVIVTLTWLWLSAYVFLMGAELNAELERQVDGEGPVSAAQDQKGGQPAPSAASSVTVAEPHKPTGKAVTALVIVAAAVVAWRTRLSGRGA